MDPATLMALGLGIQASSTLASSYAQASALKTKGDFERQQADANARIAIIQAEDALLRGEKESNLIKRKAAQLRGKQMAILASRGVNVESASALDILQETDVMAEIDMTKVKSNAWRESWGYKVQATDYGFKGRLAQRGANQAAETTLVTGGLAALSYGAQAFSYGKGFGSQQKSEGVEGLEYKKTVGDDLVKQEKNRIISDRTKSKYNPIFAGEYLDSSWWLDN